MLYCDGAADTAHDVLCLPQTKMCTGCKIEKPLCVFGREKSGKFGRYSLCKPCHSAAIMRRRNECPELRKRANDRTTAWHQANRDNPEYREKSRERAASWYLANRGNPELKRKTAERRRVSLENDPRKKANANVARAIHANLTRGQRVATGGAWRYLQYHPIRLLGHLEKQFKHGMNWDNYGKTWHIDHIVPVSSFNINAADPKNCPEFQACWALSNLRPLRKRENLAKSAKRLFLI